MIPATALPAPVRIVGLLLAGALQTLSIAPFDWWPLGLISIALLVYLSGALSAPAKQADTGGAFSKGWIFGLGLFGSGASWVYVSIHDYGYAPPWLAGSLTLVFVAGLALFPALQLWLHRQFSSSHAIGNALLFTSIWVLGDMFRSQFLTGFPWLFLGYGHLDTPLAGWVPVLGVYGVTFICVLTAAMMCAIFAPLGLGLRIAALLLPALMWWEGNNLRHIEWTHDSEYEMSAALVQTNIPQELKWQPAQREATVQLLRDMTEAHWDQHIVVWPETALPVLYDQAKPFLDRMGEQAAIRNTNIISGIPYREFLADGRSQVLHNSIVSIGVGDGINHKQRLVPFGEYVPLQDYLRGLIAFFDLPMSDFRKGPPAQELLLSHAMRVAPFICYEVVYPDFVATRSRNADYLITISNDSWFGHSLGPLQHLQMAQMRAAENGRYMLRGTNNGVSAIIDHKGRIVARSEQFVRTVLTGSIRVHQGTTPFTRFASTPILALCGLLLSIALLRRWQERRAVSAPAKLG